MPLGWLNGVTVYRPGRVTIQITVTTPADVTASSGGMRAPQIRGDHCLMPYGTHGSAQNLDVNTDPGGRYALTEFHKRWDGELAGDAGQLSTFDAGFCRVLRRGLRASIGAGAF